MSKKKNRRICTACHWRKFRAPARDRHPTNSRDSEICPECNKQMPYLYECDCDGRKARHA